MKKCLIDSVPFKQGTWLSDAGTTHEAYDFIDGSLYGTFYFDYLVERCTEADVIWQPPRK
jgi:hypothetical protein